ncbi:MAG: hypothetical protein HYX62_04320 [Gammaproteobacteria bacterium]|nr:hypothetical protein [Gammaproteobacteria bacterium]
MKIKATLHPGQNGTKQLTNQYGDQLICVRYRYDKARQKRIKTVELIIDEQDWIPGVTIPCDKVVSLKIGFGETELREKVNKEIISVLLAARTAGKTVTVGTTGTTACGGAAVHNVTY